MTTFFTPKNKYEAYQGTKDAAHAHSTYAHQAYRREYFRSINIRVGRGM